MKVACPAHIAHTLYPSHTSIDWYATMDDIMKRQVKTLFACEGWQLREERATRLAERARVQGPLDKTTAAYLDAIDIALEFRDSEVGKRMVERYALIQRAWQARAHILRVDAKEEGREVNEEVKKRITEQCHDELQVVLEEEKAAGWAFYLDKVGG